MSIKNVAMAPKLLRLSYFIVETTSTTFLDYHWVDFDSQKYSYKKCHIPITSLTSLNDVLQMPWSQKLCNIRERLTWVSVKFQLHFTCRSMILNVSKGGSTLPFHKSGAPCYIDTFFCINVDICKLSSLIKKHSVSKGKLPQ